MCVALIGDEPSYLFLGKELRLMLVEAFDESVRVIVRLNVLEFLDKFVGASAWAAASVHGCIGSHTEFFRGS